MSTLGTVPRILAIVLKSSRDGKPETKMKSIGRQILVASISVLLLLVGSSALVVHELSGWDDASAYVMRDYRRALLDGEFQEALTRATGETANYVQTGKNDYRSEAVAALARATKAVAMLREIADAAPVHPGDLSHVQFLERQERLLRSTQESINKVASAIPEAGTADAAEKLRQIYAHEAEADGAWLDIVAHHRAERLENEQTLHDHSRRARLLVLASVGALAVWLALLIAYVQWRVVKPLVDLAQLTSSIGAGDLMQSAPVTHRNEIGQLQRSFNQMVGNLAQQRRDLATLVQNLSVARDVAETANQAKSHFLANVSHELRTPMNGVIVTLDLMHETAPNQEQRDLTDLARASARSLRGMLNDLLDFSRIDAGKLELNSTSFDPRLLVTQMVELHGKRAAATGVALTCNIAAEIPTTLCGDPIRLGQILLNLLDNAIKFTERGSIDVSVVIDAAPIEPTPAQETAHGRPVWLRFRVTDTGIGVPAEAAQKIFWQFYQAEGSANRSYAGMGLGLGLGIARKLAHMMSGELGFESDVGKGSSFWFTARLLPEARPGEAVPPAALPPRRLPAGSRVLLVEDNRDNREVMARVLERRGLRVTLAENGRHALARAATEKFDVILMDCRMPEMDGFEATRAIRALGGECAEDPIIALTAYRLNGQTQRYFDAGFSDLVAKPYTAEEIEAVLYRWLVLQRRG